MKRTILIFGGGLALAALAAFAYAEMKRRKEADATASNQATLAESNTPLTLMKFRGFNFKRQLNSQTKQALAEITALQYMINAYYNGEQSIDITGVYDQQTTNAVRDITGKTSTSLFEFQYQQLIKKRGSKVAQELIASLTITGK